MPVMRQTRERASRQSTLLLLGALAVMVLILLSPPRGLLDKADHAAFAVCHRIEARSFSIAGRPLPLCARCSGTYLAALGGLAALALRGRIRADRLPARPYLFLFGVFVTLWAIDGINSFLTFFPGLPHLYEPRNTLRLITGTLQGLALTAILLPMINRGFRSDQTNTPWVANAGDFLALLAAGALVVLAVRSEWSLLLYPLALISGLAVVGFATLINALFLTMLSESRRAGWIRPRGARVTLAVALALVQLSTVALTRSALELRLGRPF
jgi:uncharacterized membrane protein